MRLSQRVRCLLCGHEPGERDWVGQPVRCKRCRQYDTEMSRRAWERMCGRAAILDWRAEATRRLAERCREQEAALLRALDGFEA